MKILPKPKNKWGWVRVFGWVVFALVVIWILLAVLLRGLGNFQWLEWSGYQNFSLMNGLELAVVILLVTIGAGWLEEHDSRVDMEQAHHQAAERAAEVRRKEIIHQLQEALQPDISLENRSIAAETIRSALSQLDGKGKGEVLLFLYNKGYLSGETPVIDLRDADLTGMTIHKAHLNHVCLREVSLTRAKLDGIQAENSRLTGSDLSRAFLRHADLKGAELAGSNLSRTHLEHADLEGADLGDANLKNTFLIKANLKNCTLNSLAILDQTISVDTVYPDGRKVTNDKGKEYLRNKEIAVLVDKL